MSTTVIYAYFGGLGADKQTSHELVLEYRRWQYMVTAITRPYPLARAGAGRWRWLGLARNPTTTRRLYQGPEARLALRTLLVAARAANLAAHGQRFCYVLPSAPAQPGALAALVPPQLRADGSLPLHPQLWQIGRSLATLPAERHGQACTDKQQIIHLSSASQSLDEAGFR